MIKDVENTDMKARPLLSICIATFNRGKFIKETLDSIMCQNNNCLEIIVLDGGSSDDTQQIALGFQNEFDNFHYYREDINSGVDSDYDKAISYASGEYCWLMTDDDLLVDNAISEIIKLLYFQYDLVVVNAEIWNVDFTKNLYTRMLNHKEDKFYSKDEESVMFTELATCLSFIGSVIIRREKWLQRERKAYYGSLFIHVGVIFQEAFQNGTFAFAKPVLKIRYGNGMWTPRSFEIWYFMWPKLIWSFPRFNDKAKQKIVLKEPWRRPLSLLKSKAMGDFSRKEFTTFISNSKISVDYSISYFISILNPRTVNLILVIIYTLFRRSAKYTIFDLLRSKHSSRGGVQFAKLVGIDLL